jgi:hypothetical protein
MRKSYFSFSVLLSFTSVFVLLSAADGAPSGIWHGKPGASVSVPAGKWCFRRTFDIPGKGSITSASCAITADNAFVLFVNGKKVGSGGDWQRVYNFDIKAQLRPGKNLLAVEGINWKAGAANPAALFVGMRVSCGGEAIRVHSDTQWKSSATEAKGWKEAGFDDSQWASARAVGWSGWDRSKLVAKVVEATVDPARRQALKLALARKTLVKRTTDKLALARKTLGLVEKAAKRPKLTSELSALAMRVEKALASPDLLTEEIYNEVSSLRRRIIFSHPLLNFERLLINKRPPTGYSHMSRQYLGRYSRPGPGLAVLEAWKDKPREKLLVEGKLPVGSVLHPDLSYDAKKILFSFCDHTERTLNLRTFCLYEIGTNGKGLKQLTGKPADALVRSEGRRTTLIEDWDPCYLPDGGIAFVSTRHQAHIRCQYGGRYFANFVLYRCDANGRNIRRISFNEACDWEPSLLDDGRIVYTRWDYVNRHFSYFQGLWVTRPDGSATALVYKMWSRNPCMTGEPRLIPGSNKIVSTAMAHHGYTAGSLIVIDPEKGQEGLEPITRLTPDISFPETEAWPKGGAYCNPYPLSEDLFLTAYTPDNLVGEGRVQETNAYGIYLLDSLGGRELIYRDTNMSCFAPIPIRPRRKPPALPSLVDAKLKQQSGVFYVGDVYQSTQPIPKDSVKALRVVRMYAQTIENPPSRGKAIIDMPKRILGTAPVDKEGRVAFRAPSGQPLLFQLIDENGMCVMSMRSAVYLQPGEVSGCVGCHEPRDNTTRRVSLSKNVKVHDLTPPVGPRYDGGISFPRTVQPVLDRYCIQCHGLGKTEGKIILLGRMKNVVFPYPAWPGPNRMVVSDAYESLVNRKGMVSIAQCNFEGDFSKPKDYFAHAGKLAGMLLQGHPDKKGKAKVKLDPESFHRVVDWLDQNAICYGDYSWNKVEWRKARPAGEKALREHIGKIFGAKLAAQPFEALVNVGQPDESRILKAPLAKNAGGWGQFSAKGGPWRDTDDPGYRKMRKLVEAAIAPLEARDIAGTCGRKKCLCRTCWVRHAVKKRPH